MFSFYRNNIQRQGNYILNVLLRKVLFEVGGFEGHYLFLREAKFGGPYLRTNAIIYKSPR